MSDKKISALTSATTPLAGTEVLPVVQSATTKKTAVSTIKDYILGLANTFTANQAIQTTSSTASKLTIISDLDGGSDFQSNVEVRRSTVAAGARWKSKRNTGIGGVGWVAQTTVDNGAEVSGTYTDAIEITNDGNLKISVAGKGIDFSADGQAAGMTSELLDDYEEGTWTPALSDGTNSASFAANSGWYTKVGNIVTVGFNAYNLDVSGLAETTSQLSVTGLPFTASKASYNATALPLNISGENICMQINSSTAVALLYRSTGTVDSTILTRAGASTPNNMSIYGQISYVV